MGIKILLGSVLLLVGAAGAHGKKAATAVPAPSAGWLWSAYLSASPIIVACLIGWACITLLTYLIPVLLANVRGVQDLKKKYGAEWALVTGASSGIGKALAEALAAQELNVVLAALDDDLLRNTFAELKAKYPRVEFRCVGVDLTQASGDYMGALERVTADIHVSLLFLNAGFMVTGFFHDVPIGKHMANLQCNAVAGCRIAHHFLPRLYAKKTRGLIVFTSSSAAFIPSPFTSLYSATKAFISRFASSLAAEAGPQGIDVMAVHPSPVRSNFLANTTNFDIINDFYKFSTGPEAVPPQIFRKVGRGQVLADLGVVSVAMRLVTKLIDDNFFATCFSQFATLLPDYQRLAGAAGLTAHLPPSAAPKPSQQSQPRGQKSPKKER